MKTLSVAVAAVLLALAGSGSAWAEHGHDHGGGHGGGHWEGHGGHWEGHEHHFRSFVGIGFGPYWEPWPYRYGYPFYSAYAYYPPVVVAPAAPPVYIEQPSLQAAPSASANYWYYCNASRSYYPYVTECPGGWQQVTPQPPPPH